MKIVWSPLALARVQDCADYIASENLAASDRWIALVLTRVGLLSTAPRLGRMVPELANPDLREVLVGSYRIIYRICGVEIHVLTVRHSRQRPVKDDEIE